MRHRLRKTPLLQHEDIFIGDQVHKRIVDDIQPDILRQVVLMNADRAVFFEESVFLRIPERIAGMSSFHRPESGMRIQVDRIDLGQRDQPGLMQAFGSALDQRIGIVVTAAYNDWNLSRGRDQLDQRLHGFIDRMDGMPESRQLFFAAKGICFDQPVDLAEIEISQHKDALAGEEIVTLLIEKALQKKGPCRTRPAAALIRPDTYIFRDTEQDVLSFGVFDRIRDADGIGGNQHPFPQLGFELPDARKRKNILLTKDVQMLHKKYFYPPIFSLTIAKISFSKEIVFSMIAVPRP